MQQPTVYFFGEGHIFPHEIFHKPHTINNRQFITFFTINIYKKIVHSQTNYTNTYL